MTAWLERLAHAPDGVLVIAALAALAGLYYGFNGLRRVRRIEDVPTARVRSAPQGYVELAGKAFALDGEPIIAPFSKTQCCWYSYRVERRGDRGPRPVESGHSDAIFLLRDDTGECVIDPEGAEVTSRHTTSWSDDGSGWGAHGVHARLPSLGGAADTVVDVGGKVLEALGSGVGDYRYTESVILDGDPLYAIGRFRTVAAGGYGGSLDERTGAILREWKRHPDTLRERFDRDRDGRVDLQEWEHARRVAAREANTIRHLIPLDSLMALTAAAEWRVTSVNSDAITPSSVAVRPQSYVGASQAQPVVVNSSILYGAARGGHVRELAYNWQAGGYITGDLSLRAPHLFDGFDIKDIAFQKSPAPVAWFVSSSGKLLGLTYVPEQQVGAWHQHDTDGTFESVACVAEGAEDAVYAVVRRTINGQSVRYIERMAPRLFGEQENAFFVDSGLTYEGPPADTISGLAHLEGCTVSILADGAAHPPRVVSSGAVQLDVEASVVHVGLPIEADAQTLPLAFEIQGFGQGRQKNVNKAWLRVFRSSGIFAGPSFDRLTEAKQRTTEPYGSPPALKSEEIPIVITPSWTDNGQVCVRQSDPLPLTIVSMSLEVSIGG